MRPNLSKTLARALVCGFLLSVLGSLFPAAAVSAELPQNILRLHVVAHSNDSTEQALKLRVRDAVLEEAARLYSGAVTMEEANAAVCTHLEGITAAAQRALEAAGSPHSAVAQVTDMWFPTRDYEGFSLPAGTYRTLRVTIGEGAGRNWWCVVFPALCIPCAQEVPAAQGEMLAELPESQRTLMEHPQEYRVAFKVVEWYEELRRWLAGAA